MAMKIMPAPLGQKPAVPEAQPVASSKDKKAKVAALTKLSASKEYKDKGIKLVKLSDKVFDLLPGFDTGLPTFDFETLQTGGVPDGRVIEVSGPESAGKTSVTLHMIAEAQKQGKVCAFVDAEHALDPNYARKVHKVNVDELFVVQPDSGEQALQIVDDIVNLKAADLIVIDSVAALVPEAELNGEIGDAHVGLQARLMSQALRILTAKSAKAGVTLIFINQIREKIGVMFGSPETTTGGRALKFFASIRLDVRRQSKPELKQGDQLIGHVIKLKAVKNKCGVPFRETFVNLMYDDGFDKVADLAAYAVKKGVIEQSGAYYYFKGENIAQGEAKLAAALREECDLYDAVKNAVRIKVEADIESEKKKALESTEPQPEQAK